MGKLSWNQPICERCWIDQRGTWEDCEDGSDCIRLVSLVWPVVVGGGEHRLEVCAFCMGYTILGAFVRQDPATVKHPHEEDD